MSTPQDKKNPARSAKNSEAPHSPQQTAAEKKEGQPASSIHLGESSIPKVGMAGLVSEEGSNEQNILGMDFENPDAMFTQLEETPDRRGGRWLITFADLMALLLSFFILLFAISQLDLQKFREIARSMSRALGGNPVIIIQGPGETAQGSGQAAADRKEQARLQRTFQYGQDLRGALTIEISQEMLDVEIAGQLIIIHILQHGTFVQGSSTLDKNFLPTAKKIRDALVDIPGDVTIAGHTDDLPISGGRWRSNWELSGARAFSVMHELLKGGVLEDSRFVLKGLAATNPRLPNTSEYNRARNRRVEIIIDQRTLPDEKLDIMAQI